MRYCLILLVLFSDQGLSTTKSKVISEELSIVLNSMNNSTVTYKYKLRVNDEYGKSFGQVFFSENKYRSLKKFRASIVKNGKVIRKYKTKDLEKQVCSGRYELYSGNTCYYGYFEYSSSPYILNVEYTVKINSLFFVPNWFPQSKLPVENSSYTITNKTDVKLNWQSNGSIPDPVYSNDSTSITWSVNTLKSLPNEKLLPPEAFTRHSLLINPSIIKFENSKINMDSWESIGYWYNSFIQGQDDLFNNAPRSRKNISEAQKASFIDSLYNHLQNTTRYVAVELNEHGWLPHLTSEVKKYKYGDCKDLSFYFISLLKHYNITAYPALVLTRDNGYTDPSFPSIRFNHFVTMIPLNNDTIWVDCTSDYATIHDYPAGIEGTNALVVTGKGGKLLHIPSSQYEDNKTVFKGRSEISESGRIEIVGAITFTGNDAQQVRGAYNGLTVEEWRHYLLAFFDESIPVKKLHSYTVTDRKKDNLVTIDLHISGEHFTNIVGERLLFNASLFNKVIFDVERIDKRKNDVFYNYPFTVSDTIEFILPVDYSVLTLPDSMSYLSNYGAFNATYSHDESQISLVRTRQIYHQTIPVEDYNKYYELIMVAKRSDKSQIQLIKMKN